MTKNKLSRVEVDVNALKGAIESGLYTPEQVEQISTSLRVGLASSLMNSIAILEDKDKQLSSAVGEVVNTLTQKIKLDTDSGLLKDYNYDELLKIFDTLVKAQINIAEVKRRVFNGKDLFSVDPLSAQDRALMDLFKQVGSPEKKEKLKHFITELCDDAPIKDEFE